MDGKNGGHDAGRMRSMLDYVLDAVGRARSALTTLFDLVQIPPLGG